MDIQGLVRLDKSQHPLVAELLSESFMQDPLYEELIPDMGIRRKLAPLYFKRYLECFSGYFHLYADSAEINGIVIFFDDGDSYSAVRYLADGLRSGLMTAADVVRSDPSLRTALRFLRGLRYLKSTWVHRVVRAPTVHIDFLAVRPEARGRGVAGQLMRPVLDLARGRNMPATLETHNPHNIPIYSHFGFRTIFEMDGGGLRQYCMIG